MDHPKFNLGNLRYPKINLIKKIELKKKRGIFYYHGLSLSSKIQNKKKLLNSYIRFERSEKKINKFLRRLKFLSLNNFIKNKHTYNLRLFCEMRPNKTNEIRLINGKIHVNYNFSINDVETIKLLTNEIINFFSIHPKKEKKITWSMKILKNKMLDASHHMGGMVYSRNKNKAVVDKHLKIIGLRKIYICSSSVFPSSGSVNPTMTICVLANRLGKYLIKKRYK